jgi:membrane protease YdiL (CAAX protease family)
MPVTRELDLYSFVKQHREQWGIIALVALYVLVPLVARLAIDPVVAPDAESDGNGISSYIGALWPNLLVLTIIVFFVIRNRIEPAEMGFNLRRGTWISLALVAVCAAVMGLQAPIIAWENPGLMSLLVLGAWAEELIFRALLINLLMQLLSNCSRRHHWAILISGAVFGLCHIPMVGTAQLFSVVLGGILFGYIYHWTNSLLLPLFVHTVANTAVAYGLLGGLVTLVLYFLVAQTARRWFAVESCSAASGHTAWPASPILNSARPKDSST